jgi:enamine deaminase RidA (YjgF/YER057c/UK114 family)
MRQLLTLAALPIALVVSTGCATAQDEAPAIERVYNSPTARIASLAMVPPGSEIIFVSGTVPAPLDPANPDDMGDTRQQTLSVLNRIKASLESQGYGMGDIVKMTVFLVGVPELGGRMDSAAMNEVFATFFADDYLLDLETDGQAEHRHIREVIGRRELYRRLSRIAETVVDVADRVWYAAVKEL